MLNTHKDVFQLLSTCKRDQLDPTVCCKLAALAESEFITPSELCEIVDECQTHSLGSDSAIRALNIVLHSLQREEQEVDSKA